MNGLSALYAKLASAGRKPPGYDQPAEPPQAQPMPIFGAPAPAPPKADGGGLLSGAFPPQAMPLPIHPQPMPQPMPPMYDGNSLASLLNGGWNKAPDWYGASPFPPQAQPFPIHGGPYGAGGATTRGQGNNGGMRSSTYGAMPEDDYRGVLGWGAGP